MPSVEDIPIHGSHKKQQKSFDISAHKSTGLKAHGDHTQMLHEPEPLPAEDKSEKHLKAVEPKKKKASDDSQKKAAKKAEKEKKKASSSEQKPVAKSREEMRDMIP